MSMVAMPKTLEGSSGARDNLLASKHNISNAKTTSLEISNTKQAIEMGVMSKEDGKKRN